MAIGIALQNFPEGSIISMPLHAAGEGKILAFINGILSGIVEPIAALFIVWAASFVTPAMPYFLSFAAGARIYVLV